MGGRGLVFEKGGNKAPGKALKQRLADYLFGDLSQAGNSLLKIGENHGAVLLVLRHGADLHGHLSHHAQGACGEPRNKRSISVMDELTTALRGRQISFKRQFFQNKCIYMKPEICFR